MNTLVLVHRQQLVRQWKERLSSFLDLPTTSIGQISGGKRKPTGIVDVATIQSLNQDGVVDDLVEQYGQVIVDECHGVGSVDFEQVRRSTTVVPCGPGGTILFCAAITDVAGYTQTIC